MARTLTIATRRSPLAVWQARHIADLIAKLEPGTDVQLLELETKGDKILDQALSKVGGKDLFVKEIENALLDGRAQVAVHSLKDVPTVLPPGLAIMAYPTREDPRDALVSLKGFTLDRLPKGARVGTCSLRRAAQLLRRRPDLRIEEIRGNVQTRLQRMEERDMDATMLAYAGLTRLGMTHVATEVLDPMQCLPAIGQGILAVEAREDDEDTGRVLAKLDDASARAAAVCERSFLHRLEGGCQVPIAGHASIAEDELSFRGLVLSLDGKQAFEHAARGSTESAAEVGVHAAEKLLKAGAASVLAHLKANPPS